MLDVLGPIAYFGAGVATAVLWALLETKAKSRNRSRWTSVSSLRWSWDFDYTFQHPRDALTIARDVAEFAAAQVERDRERIMLEDVRVDPGSYTVRMGLTASFVRRELPPARGDE